MKKKYVYLIIILAVVSTIYLVLFNKKNVDAITDSDIDKISLYINGNEIEYYFVDTYYDKGAVAMLDNKDISHLIKVSNSVNKSIPGEYEVLYKIGVNNRTIEQKRIVYIEELDLDQQFDIEKSRVKLTIKNEGYSHTILPDGIKEESNSFNYTYDDKGNNKFAIYLKGGSKKDYNLNISNVDMSVPTGTCISELKENNIFNVTVNATSNSGIAKYQYNNHDYTSNTFSVASENGKIVIKVFGNNGNFSEIKCNNVYGLGFKNPLPNKQKLGYVKCNSDIQAANIKLDELMQSYGERSRSAVAAAALFLADYDYSIPYQWGGKYLKKGLNPEWGCDAHTELHNNELVCTKVTGSNSCERGLDCTGYTSWAFFQAGFDKSIIRTSSQSTDNWGNFNAGKHKYAFNSSNRAMAELIKPGDLVWREGHVGIVIGVDAETLQIANELGPIIVQTNKKSNGESTSGQAAFTHFVLFDDFYNMYGSNT